jgi:Ca2+-binding EF-hand superfamily protein
LRAKIAETAAASAAEPVMAVAVSAPAMAVATAVPAPVEAWAKAVFAQFDTNADGKIDTNELKRAIKSLPVVVPRNAAEAQAMGDDLDELIGRMDSSGDGQLDESEWIGNIRACGGLHARIAAAIGEDGTVATFRDFEDQKEKREGEITALEAKAERSEDEEKELASYKKQVESLTKKITERNSNMFKVAEWGKTMFTQFDKDGNGKLDNKELSEAIKAIPRTKPKYAPKNTKYMSIGDMVAAMDADGDGMVSLEEWLDSIGKCAGLCAAFMEHQVDGKLPNWGQK